MVDSLSRRLALGGAAFTVATSAAALPARAQAAQIETIAVIGTGNVGSTLGKAWAAVGHKIVYGSRAPDSDKVKALVVESGPNASAALPKDSVQNAGLVLLAIPSASAVEIVTGLGDLKGKVLIDATNLLSIVDGKIVEPAECLADQIRAAAPNANLIKAFNTTNTKVMVDPAMTGGTVTLPLAGASMQSKKRVAQLAAALGLETVDIGGNDMLRMAEHLGRLYVGYGVKNRPQRLEFQFRTWGA